MKRLIDYFLVIDLGDKITPQNVEDYQPKKEITNLDLYYGYGGNKVELMSGKDEKWIDLDGSKTVWLKVSYNQQSSAITNVDFLRVPVEKRKLKIEASTDVHPVPLKRLVDDSSEPKFEGVSNGFAYYSGNYDLTEILGFEKELGFITILAYKNQNKKNYETPLEEIGITVAEKKKENNGQDKVQVNLVKGYEIIKRHYGRTQNTLRFLTFKRGPNILEDRYAAHISSKYPVKVIKGVSEASDAVAMFCFPKGIALSREMREPAAFSFVLTKEDGARIYGTSLVFDEEIPPEIVDQLGHIEISNKKPLYTQKALCLISHYAFLVEFRDALKQIYQIHLSKNDLPIERVICNLIDETPVPVKGKTAVLVEFGQPIQFQRPLNFPLISESAIKNLFTTLSCHKVINLIECVLLERKILLISKYRTLLTDVAQAITSLIFPFKWTQVLIPILPEQLKSYIEAPVPYIIGLSLAENEDVEFAANDIVKVYLDTAEIVYSESLPPLPEKYHKRLIKRLEPFAFLHDNCQLKLQDCDLAFEIKSYDPDRVDKEIDAYEIRNAFLSFILSILKYHDKYFAPPKARKDEFLELKDLFNITEFLVAMKANKEGTFLSKLVETGLFTYFIETRVINNKYEDEYKFVDQCIKKLKSKKDYKFITPIKPEKTIKTFMPNDEGIKKGQLFYYHLFPKLNENYFILPRMPESTLVVKESSTKDSGLAVEDLIGMDDLKWAKFLLEMMYTLWFAVLTLKLKKDFSEYYNKLTEYANIVFENLKNKGIKPNQTIYKSLIEACSYCGMNDQALEIVTKLKESKTEISPFAHGVYLEAISKARQFKFDQAKRKSTEETKEENLENHHTQVEKCTLFLLSTKCKHCSETLYAEDVISGWKRSYNEYITQCPFCSQNFTPEIQVIQQAGSFQFETEFYMLNPLIIKKELDNLMESKGENLEFLERFELDHKHIYWNIYLYSKIIQVPVFFLEKHLDPAQLEENMKELDREIQAHTLRKNTKANSLFMNTLFIGRTNSAPKKTGTDSAIGPVDGNKPSKHSEGEISLQRSHSSIIVNMNKAKETNANPSIKKVFGDLLDDLRDSLERKLVDYELEIRLKQTEDSNLNLDCVKENEEKDENDLEKPIPTADTQNHENK